MKKKKFRTRVFAALFACIILLSILNLTAYAADNPTEVEDAAAVDQTGEGENPDSGEGSGENSDSDGEDNPSDDSEIGADSTEAPDNDPDAGNVTPTDSPEDHDDPTEEPDDSRYEYTQNEHTNELPEADDEEIVFATAVVVPKTEVSDASLFSGIVMWLCVAVGIAVVVGVMVSKRTRRRG